MAGNVTKVTKMVVGTSKVLMYISIDSDGTEETDLVVYDSSAIATLLGKTDPLFCKINSIHYSTNSLLGVVKLEWDASTDVLAWALPANGGSNYFCFHDFGGLNNTAGSGITGDITLTTTGLVAGDCITMVLDVRPF